MNRWTLNSLLKPIVRWLIACSLVHGLGLDALKAQPSHAQAIERTVANDYNDFQRHVRAGSLDSAYADAQAVANQNVPILNGLLHDAFMQSFLPTATARADTAFTRRLLRQLFVSTTSKPLQQSVYPLYKWVEVQTTLADTVRTRQVVANFLTGLARSPEERGNRIERYALGIYALLKTHKVYAALADTLLERTRQRLDHAVSGRYFQPAEERTLREARAYFRYLMAYSSWLKAQAAKAANDTAQQATYLKVASQFSPDETDRLAPSAYFYESVFFFGNGEIAHFHQPYIDFLLAKGGSAAVVPVITQLAIADPAHIDLLKTYYVKAPVVGQSFRQYWTKAINEKLKPAEPFALVDLTGNGFDYSKHRGKWILLDFWGTWCKPCVAELPAFQAFYDQVRSSKRTDLVVLTIACHDLEQNVRDFIQKKGYTFPVAMGNEAVIKAFRVGEYPTKVLITPQGNRMKLPFGTNWTERINIYTRN